MAIDPGLTTGVAFNIHGSYETVTMPDIREVYDFILQNQFDDIICEQFVSTNIHSNKYGVRVAELVGGVEAICYSRSIRFTRRTPQQRALFMDRANAMLRADKSHAHTPHEHDALAHLLAWEAKQGREKANLATAATAAATTTS